MITSACTSTVDKQFRCPPLSWGGKGLRSKEGTAIISPFNPCPFSWCATSFSWCVLCGMKVTILTRSLLVPDTTQKIMKEDVFIDRVTDSIAFLLLKSKLSHFCMHSCTTVNHRILCPTSKLAFLFPKEKVSTSKACFFSTFFLEKKTRCRSKFFAAAAGESESSTYKKIERQPSPEWWPKTWVPKSLSPMQRKLQFSLQSTNSNPRGECTKRESKQGVDSREQVKIALNENDEPKTWDPKISILYEKTPNSATNPQIPNEQRGGETKNQVSGHSPNTW